MGAVDMTRDKRAIHFYAVEINKFKQLTVGTNWHKSSEVITSFFLQNGPSTLWNS